MTAADLRAALRACADGSYALEAGVEFLISHATWLDGEDFASSFIRAGASSTDAATLMAMIDWAAAITALNAANCPAPAANPKYSG